MKIKSLIKLICLVVVLAFLGLWAFGANVTLYTKKFVAWDKNMMKGNDIGTSNVMVYSISAPEKTVNFDTHAAAIKAVEVFKARAEIVGYKNANIRLMGNDKVFVGLPSQEATASDSFSIFQDYNGKITVANQGKTIFTNDGIKKAQITGVNADYDAYCVDVYFTEEASQKIKEISSASSYTISFGVDGEVVAEYKSNDPVEDGKLTLEFDLSESTQASIFEICANSGCVEGTIAAEDSFVLEGTAGLKAFLFIGIVALVILVLAAAYFIFTNRMLGVAATISMFMALLLVEFFAATFTWFSIDAWAVAGLLAGFVLTVITHMLVINSISKQYQAGKDIKDALNLGVASVKNILFEIMIVALVVGVGLWIYGTNMAYFGIGIMGSSIVAAISVWLFVKPIAKIFIGLGLEDAKAYGLKRGE